MNRPLHARRTGPPNFGAYLLFDHASSERNPCKMLNDSHSHVKLKELY